MKLSDNNFPVLFVFLGYFLLQVISEDVCVKKGPCSCEFPNGTGIDLSATVTTAKFYSAQSFAIKNNGTKYEISTYFYHPCYDAKLDVNSTNSNDTCGMPLSICRNVTRMNQQTGSSTYVKEMGPYEYMGTSNVTQFSADGKSINYFNVPSSTVVNLVCTEADDVLQVLSTEEPNKIELAFYSRSACLRQLEEPGRSFGSTLLIIFFSCVIFYLVLGICTKKFLMGATGIEVIPNLGFWSDLPHLVRDGWAFTVNGFKLPARGPGPAASPDPNSYDSI